MTLKLNETIARKVLETVDAGLVNGMGKPVPGQMCVEAAVCFAYGLPHSDNPPCVGSAVRSFKIKLNDARWSSVAARTQGMRALAIAQLGSDAIDQLAFAKMVTEGAIRVIVPMAMRRAAEMAKEPHKATLLAVADHCENEGTPEAAQAARDAAYAYACAAAAVYRDSVLNACADIGLQALIALDSPGCKYLFLLDEEVEA